MVDLNTTHQVATTLVQAGDGISQWSINLISILLFLLIVVTVGFLWAMGKMSRFVSKTWTEAEIKRAAQIEKEFVLVREVMTQLANKFEAMGNAFIAHEKEDTARHFALSERVVKAESILKFVDRRRPAVIPTDEVDA